MNNELIAGASDERARFRAIFETAVDGILTIDDHGIIESANRTCLRMFGYSPEELVGRNVSLLMPEPYRGLHDAYLSNYLQTGEAKIIGIGREVLGLRKDGSEFPADLAVSELSVGRRRLFTGIVRDITERKVAEEALRESEQRFRALVLTAGIVIVLLDGEQAILEWNREAQALFGWSREEAIGADFSRLLFPVQARDELRRELVSVLEGTDSQGFESMVVTKAGVEKTLLWNSTRQLAASGAGLGIIACGQDITEYKRLLKELVEQQALARLGRWVAVVAHEVRNPLAGIAGALKIISGRMTENTGDRAIINQMLERLSVLNEVVSDLLIYARPTSPKLAPVPLQFLIEDSILLLSEDPAFHDIELSLAFPDEHSSVIGDAAMLKIAIQNFLINAAESMAGSGTIDIAFEVEVEASQCYLRFKDQGPGIAAEVRAHVFEPFFTTKSSGNGLGLAVAKRIIDSHRGQLSLICPPEGGTVVQVQLPVVRSR